MPITNSGNRDFGAVFRPAHYGGPRYSVIKNGQGLPNWPDIRRPGNTNVNEPAARIMDQWDVNRTKRFEIFMERFYTHQGRGPEPWRREWLEKTTGNFIKSGELKIVKCKLELIKRLLIIQTVGPQSLEDWVLLFLYYDNELAIPPNIEQLMHPDSGDLLTGGEFLRDTDYDKPNPKYYAITAPNNAMKYPGNLPLFSFRTQNDRPRFVIRHPLQMSRRKRNENLAEFRARMTRFPGIDQEYIDPRLNVGRTRWWDVDRNRGYGEDRDPIF